MRTGLGNFFALPVAIVVSDSSLRVSLRCPELITSTENATKTLHLSFSRQFVVCLDPILRVERV